MIYILDTANLDAIRHCNEFYPLAGVTTNPSIIAKAKTDFWPLVEEIRAIIGPDKMLHVQTTQEKAEDIVEEAKLLKERLGGEFYVKIPIGEEGLKATMMLSELGIGVTMTAIFTPTQALMAAMAGADFVAPYVNRLVNILADGVAVVRDIADTFAVHDIGAEVLAASFKSPEQVIRVALAGGHTATLPPDVLKGMLTHPLTGAAIDSFAGDWNKAFGGATLREMLTK
jgi:fructose-6-phosphate aldolase 2